MSAPGECAVDTTVLQKANAPLEHDPREAALFRHRLRLLRRIQERKLTVLLSEKLVAEYRRQVRAPRNEYVRAFFELLTSSATGPVLWNWKRRWSGSDRSTARRCGYPREDDHVLRTAITPNRSVIVTEEQRMLAADACIYREFRVHIRHTQAM